MKMPFAVLASVLVLVPLACKSVRETGGESSSLASSLDARIHEIVEQEDCGETPRFRIYVKCDLDGDHKDDLVVAIQLHPNKGGDKEYYYELLCALSSSPEKITRFRVPGSDPAVRVPVMLVPNGWQVYVHYDFIMPGYVGPKMRATDVLVYSDGKLVLSAMTAPTGLPEPQPDAFRRLHSSLGEKENSFRFEVRQ